MTSGGGEDILIAGEKGHLAVNRGGIRGKFVEELKKNPTDKQWLDEAVAKLYRGMTIHGHMANFFDCVKSRALPISDVFTHCVAVNTCHTANIAMLLGRKVKWDQEKYAFLGDDEANQLTRRKQRAPYTIEAEPLGAAVSPAGRFRPAPLVPSRRRRYPIAMNFWQDKVALVTGGSSGLGRVIAEAFAAAGANVVLAALEADAVGRAADEMRAAGRNALGIHADLTRQEDVEGLFAQTLERFGRLDVLVNNAGRSMRGSAMDTTPEQFRELMELNFIALVRCTRAAVPHLLRQRGHLVNIGSLAAKSAAQWVGAYPATKFAVAAYSQQLRLELGPQGLHVLLVCPGPIRAQGPPALSAGRLAARPRAGPRRRAPASTCRPSRRKDLPPPRSAPAAAASRNWSSPPGPNGSSPSRNSGPASATGSCGGPAGNGLPTLQLNCRFPWPPPLSTGGSYCRGCPRPASFRPG